MGFTANPVLQGPHRSCAFLDCRLAFTGAPMSPFWCCPVDEVTTTFIENGTDPTSFTPMGSEADRVVAVDVRPGTSLLTRPIHPPTLTQVLLLLVISLGFVGDTAMMRRTIALLITLALGLLGRSLAADTQQLAHMPRIGMLSTGSAPTAAAEPQFGVVRQALRALGYIEEQNILVEYRYTVGRRDRIPGLIDELVHLPVDVLVLQPSLAIRAAKQATSTISIVMVATVDPVETGFVESLARLGGNIAGLTEQARALSPKRLALLRELMPVSRVGVL
jgi:ABC transporter substrate binding protein